MWRHVIIMLLGVLLGLLVGAAMDISAEPTEELVALAAEAGVDVVALEGAVVTVGETDARRYLIRTGELVPPQPPLASVWSRLAQCESTGNWSAVSRGGTYRGGLQFDQQTWAAYGGRAYASSAHLATPAQQIAIAEKLRAARGFQPWPVCSRRLGLR